MFTRQVRLKKRIFVKYLRRVVFVASWKRYSSIFYLAFVVLFAFCAYYALKCNLQPTLNSEGFEDYEATSNDNRSLEKFSKIGIGSIYGNNWKPYIARERIVHFDLKGAPPYLEYIEEVFILIRDLGATGVLIEYEDMFPYFASLTDITAHNHYSTEEVLEILNLADNSGLTIIPLIQTFGHLEFALKRPTFENLRENADSPQALCPSQNASLVFIENMISQIMKLHQHRITHIHIGCDEVYHLMECQVCRGKAYDEDDAGVARNMLFLSHVINVANIIKRRWPEVRPLIWDDMMRNISESLLNVTEIGKYVDPVVWWYKEDIYRTITPSIWQKYSRVFRTAWAASSYKGAFGDTLYLPTVSRHLENNMQWIRVMMEQTRYFKDGIAGIMLTGWQRYDHFAVLCELLPVSIPSLSLCLLALSHGDVTNRTLYSFKKLLGCKKKKGTRSLPLNLIRDPYLLAAMVGKCKFPGSNTFQLMGRYRRLDNEADSFVRKIKKDKGWLTDYNIRHGYMTAERTRQILKNLDATGLLHRVVTTARLLTKSLDGVIAEDAINEWIEQRLYSLTIQLEKTIADVKAVKSTRTWERRPLASPYDMMERIMGHKNWLQGHFTAPVKTMGFSGLGQIVWNPPAIASWSLLLCVNFVHIIDLNVQW